jgi:hypothetical protein
MIPLKKVTEETISYNSLSDYITECIDNNSHLSPIISINFATYTNLEYDDINVGLTYLSYAINDKLPITNVIINNYFINENGNLSVTTSVYEPIN